MSAQAAAVDLAAIDLILVCPSLGQRCGVSEYSRYVGQACEASFRSVHIVRESWEALVLCERAGSSGALVLLQHEYGLLDFHSRLSSTETTAAVIANLLAIARLGGSFRAGVILHSLVLHDPRSALLNEQWFNTGLPIFSLSREGARAARLNVLEHGVFIRPRIPPTPIAGRNFRIGAFGFLSDNKNPSAVFDLCVKSGSELRANFACEDPAKIAAVRADAARLGVEGRLTFDFLDAEVLLTLLSEADVLYVAQQDFSHYATSGSARFALSTGRPVIAPPHRPFDDLQDAVIYADEADAIGVVERLRASPEEMSRAMASVEHALGRSDIAGLYRDLAHRIYEGRAWSGGDTRRRRIAPGPPRDPGLNTTVQNSEGLGRLGLGVVDGRLHAVGVRPSGAAGLLGEDMTDLDAYFADKSRDLDVRLAAASPRIADVFPAEAVVEAELRALRGLHPEPVDVAEWLGLPVYAQALLLWRDVGAPLEAVAGILTNESTDASTAGSRLGWLPRLERLKRALPEALRVNLSWRRPRLVPPLQAREVVYPSALLGDDPAAFVFNLHAVFYGRPPTPVEFEAARSTVGRRLTMSEMTLLFSRTGEAATRGVQIGASLETWTRDELQAGSRLKLCAALAPPDATNRSANQAYRERRALAALEAAAQAPPAEPAKISFSPGRRR